MKFTSRFPDKAESKVKKKLRFLFNSNGIYLLLAIVIVYANGSWIYIEQNKIFNIIIIGLLIVYITLLSSKRGISFPSLLILAIMILISVSSVLNAYRINFVSYVYTLILIFLVSMIPKDQTSKILEASAKILMLLIIIAIPVYFILTFTPAKSIFAISDTLFGSYYNFGIYTHRIEFTLRSQSIFWEPGAWAVNQAFCMYWYIYIKKEYRYFLLFIVSFIITGSTTGLILLMIVAIELLFNNSFGRHNKNRMIAVIFILIGVFSISYLVFPEMSRIANLYFENAITKFRINTPARESYDVRLGTLSKSIEYANDNPIFGIGKTAFEFVTSTIADILYQFGYIFTVVYIMLFFFGFPGMKKIFRFFYILALLYGEAMSFFALSVLVINYGSMNIFPTSRLRRAHKKYEQEANLSET